jgi:peptide deformylase
MVKKVIIDYNFYNDRADEVISISGIDNILQDLKDTIIKNNYECLAAPQIGYKNRIIAMNFKGDVRFFINPSVIKFNGKMGFDFETCPSVPNAKFAILRYPEVHVSYFDENLKVVDHPMCMIGRAAMHMQRTIDILDGRLICDGSLPILDGWEKLKPQEQDEILKEYYK